MEKNKGINAVSLEVSGELRERLSPCNGSDCMSSLREVMLPCPSNVRQHRAEDLIALLQIIYIRRSYPSGLATSIRRLLATSVLVTTSNPQILGGVQGK